MYYAFINNGQIDGKGQFPCSSEDLFSVEITEEVYNNLEQYMWNGKKVVINPHYDEEMLAQAKADKYEEAKTKAYVFLESGEALYEFEPGKHIEATDGNIGKFTAYALGFMAGSTAPVVWSTKEDETVTLNAEQVTDILQGLGAVQAQVWTVEFTNYVTAIQEASTVEDNSLYVNKG